jgi:predicted metalloprotease
MRRDGQRESSNLEYRRRQARARIMPESFTHGSPAQRMRWFKRGFESGDMNQCNTFKAAQL